MRRLLLALVIASYPAPALSGAVDKFDSKTPEIEGYVDRSMFEIERCLINMNRITVPYVYRQPDRPDDAMLLWTGADVAVAARADLKRQGTGTYVRMWMGNAEVRRCAPVTNRSAGTTAN